MKELVTYRMERVVVLRIIDEAAARGMTRAELIEEWSRKVPALGKSGLLEKGSEKKSGAALEDVPDDVPDEVLKARGKRILARPEMQVPYTEAQLMGMGVKKGSQLKAPAKKKEVHEMNTQGQIERKPITRPNGKI